MCGVWCGFEVLMGVVEGLSGAFILLPSALELLLFFQQNVFLFLGDGERFSGGYLQ